MKQGISLKQILQGFVALIILLALLWVAFYVMIFVLLIAGIAAIVYYVRSFLRKQGIIQPAEDDVEDDSEVTVTVIETEYHEVKDEDKK